MSLTAAAASVKTAIDTMGKLRELTKTMQNVELKATIAELSNNLADAQTKIAELKKEIILLQEENHSLKKAHTKEPFTKKWGCYIFAGDDELYCPGCYSQGKKSPTTRVNSRLRRCTVCNAMLGG